MLFRCDFQCLRPRTRAWANLLIILEICESASLASQDLITLRIPRVAEHMHASEDCGWEWLQIRDRLKYVIDIKIILPGTQKSYEDWCLGVGPKHLQMLKHV